MIDKKESNRKAVKKYSKKTKSFALKYYATDIEEALRLSKYLEDNDISCNSYLKQLVKEDLDSKGIGYWLYNRFVCYYIEETQLAKLIYWKLYCVLVRNWKYAAWSGL